MNDLNYHSGFKTSEQAKWCIAQVNRILNNEYYIGTVVQASLGIFNILREYYGYFYCELCKKVTLNTIMGSKTS